MQKQLSCRPLRIFRRDSCNVPTPREAAGKVCFVTVWKFVFCAAVTAVALPILSCVIQRYPQGVLVRRSYF